MIYVGTGTREGMSDFQMMTVEFLLKEAYGPRRLLLHGCCVGSDEFFHEVGRALGFYIVGYPSYPIGHAMRANLECDELHTLKPPLERNRLMVNQAQLVIATPLKDEEQQRGGTWATLRYARDTGVAWRHVKRDGRIEMERKGGADFVPNYQRGSLL